jgi:hypothetical protein
MEVQRTTSFLATLGRAFASEFRAVGQTRRRNERDGSDR